MDRRTSRRYELSFPILVRVPALGSGPGYVGRTLNISTRGVHFILEVALDRGTPIDFTITLFPQVSDGTHVLVRGEGTVLWIDNSHSHACRIAAAIERYEISRERPAAYERL